MERLKYLQTREGQKNDRWHRKLSRLWLFDIEQEPKSKNSIRLQEKSEFQSAVLKVLKERKRRAYRSPIILEIDFYSNQDNPPAIHTLAKNYLDLLENPIPGLKTTRSKLAYINDRLIKILIVNYHLEVKSGGPSILIEIDTINNFIKDLQLAERIQKDDFEDNNSRYRPWHHGYGRRAKTTLRNSFEEDDPFEHNPVEALKEWERDKKDIVERNGTQVYETHRNWLLFGAQEKFLKSSGFSLDRLIMAFSNKIRENQNEDWSQLFQELDKQSRDIAVNLPMTLDLLHAPTKHGDKASFKEAARIALNNFKSKFPILFPLRTLLGVSILYMSPKKQEVDLDNLARYVIPFVHEIIQPPSTFSALFGNADEVDNDLKKMGISGNNDKARIPKYSITSYQVIQVPRYENDPEEGFVRLAFHSGLKGNAIRKELDDFIDKWEQNEE